MLVPLWDAKYPLVPFDNDGNMIAYPEHWKMNKGGTFRLLTQFVSSMTYEHYERGRSAARFVFSDEAGKQYPIFLKDMEEVIKRVGFVKGKTPRTVWTPTKRGANYGIKLADFKLEDE